MIIKRKCFSLFGFSNPFKIKVDEKPITLKEVEELNKTYPGFITIAYKNKNWNLFFLKWLMSTGTFAGNKYTLKGIKEIIDNKIPKAHHYNYVYFDPSTKLMIKDRKENIWTYKDFINKLDDIDKSKKLNINLFNKKIDFINGSSNFKSFDINKFKRNVKLDDLYKKVI